MKWQVLRGYLFSAMVLAVIVALLTVQTLKPWRSATALSSRPWPITPPGKVAIGVTTVSLARDSFRPWRLSDLREVNEFEQDARLHADIVMWFSDWAHRTFDAAQARAIVKRGSIPEICWEPWDYRIGIRHRQPKYTLESIIDGHHDAYIRRFANAVRRYGGPLRLRFAQEMNGNWYPWSETQNGNSRGQFVLAWRHVHAIFAAVGATNVTWVWSPVAGDIRRSEYPGRSEVDVLGLSGFNGGTILYGDRWRSFTGIFGRSLRAIHALAPGKPVEVSEVASTETGGHKAAWIRAMFDQVRRRPYIRALIWFNLRKETDWRIESSPFAQAAFAEGAESLHDASGLRGSSG